MPKRQFSRHASFWSTQLYSPHACDHETDYGRVARTTFKWAGEGWLNGAIGGSCKACEV